MAENSKIEWTDATWNPVTGCSVVSPGCTNCYAMRLAGTRLKHHPSRAGLTKASKAGPVWTGEVRLNEKWLDQPLRWSRERRIFVCAHGDLFHENVPDEWIDRVFAVMAMCPQHTFQVLTKRSARMRQYIVPALARVHARILTKRDWQFASTEWPLPNVWLGVSIEDLPRGKERALDLANTLAALRYWSVEPLLEDLGDLTPLCLFDTTDGKRKAVDWVICGGESGPGARHMDPDWARSLRDQCRAAGVKYFFKQMSKKEAIPADLQIREFPDAIR